MPDGKKSKAPKPPQHIKSDFAILDVKTGRGRLMSFFEYFRDRWSPSGVKIDPPTVPVMIEAEIVDSWGDDDGTSREFQMVVKKITVRQSKLRKAKHERDIP